MKKTILIFGSLVIALLLLFQISKYSLFYGNSNIEIIIAIIAVVFLAIGFFISKKRDANTPTTTNIISEQKIKELDISKREYEVLQLVSQGLSNKEIAEALCLSESTIKTHVSSLLLKLNAKRRTQAVQNAKSFQIL